MRARSAPPILGWGPPGRQVRADETRGASRATAERDGSGAGLTASSRNPRSGVGPARRPRLPAPAPRQGGRRATPRPRPPCLPAPGARRDRREGARPPRCRGDPAVRNSPESPGSRSPHAIPWAWVHKHLAPSSSGSLWTIRFRVQLPPSRGETVHARVGGLWPRGGS